MGGGLVVFTLLFQEGFECYGKQIYPYMNDWIFYPRAYFSTSIFVAYLTLPLQVLLWTISTASSEM